VDHVQVRTPTSVLLFLLFFGRLRSVDVNVNLHFPRYYCTICREMAEEAVARAIDEFGLKPHNDCITTQVQLIGAKDWTPTMFIKLIQNYGVEREAFKSFL